MDLLDGALVISDSPPMLDSPSTKVGEPGPLHPKSPVNYLDGGVLDCYGSFEGFRAEPKFHVEKSIMAPYLMEHGFEDLYSAPQAKGWKPKFEALKDLTSLDPNVDPDVVEKAADGFSKDLEAIDPKWKKEIMIYDIHTAINGVPGLRYVDGIKRSTSAGFPYRRPKDGLLVPLAPTVDYPDHVHVTPEVEERIEEMVVRLQSNRIPGSVFSAAFKNEALLRAKAETGKVRLFMMASIESTIVMRMYLLSFVRVAQMNHYLFECAPGTESQCVEWDWFYQYLTQFGKKRMIFGDFKGYDRSMHPIFILKAFDVIARFIIFCTGDLAHANAVRCIGMEIAFTRLDFFGDLVRLFGQNPSGQALTAIINGLVNSLSMRYV
jgi:hypothetical protein